MFHLILEDQPELRLTLDEKHNFRAKFNIDRTDDMKGYMLNVFKREMRMNFEAFAKRVEAEENSRRL